MKRTKGISAKLPTFDAWTVILASYLINMVHLKEGVLVQQIIIWSAAGIYLMINAKHVIQLFREVSNKKETIVILFLLGGYLAFTLEAYILGTRDSSYLSMVISMLLLVVYMLVIVVRLKKKKKDGNLMHSFMYLYAYANAAYVCMSIVLIVLPGLKSALLNLIEVSSYDQNLISNPYYATRIGWMGFSGYNSSMKCTISICFLLFMMLNTISKKEKVSIWNYALLFLLLIGNIFYARTGLLISLVCAFFAIAVLAFRKHKLGYFAVYTVVGVVVCVGVFQFVYANIGESKTLQWAFEMIDSYMREGKVSTSSSEKLMQMYFMPSTTTLLVGDGRYAGTNNGYYMNTDAGLMRNILYFGIFGTMFLYLMTVYQIYLLGRGESKREKITIITFLFLILFLGFEFKGESTVLLVPLMTILNVCKQADIKKKKVLQANVGSDS